MNCEMNRNSKPEPKTYAMLAPPGIGSANATRSRLSTAARRSIQWNSRRASPCGDGWDGGGDFIARKAHSPDHFAIRHEQAEILVSDHKLSLLDLAVQVVEATWRRPP